MPIRLLGAKAEMLEAGHITHLIEQFSLRHTDGYYPRERRSPPRSNLALDKPGGDWQQRLFATTLQDVS
jgi:hypothetical protein